MNIQQLSTRRRPGGSTESALPASSGWERDTTNLFDSFFNGLGLTPYAKDSATLLPRLNIAESEKAYELTLEVPGVDEKDIEISLSGNVLTVKGEKKDETADEGKNFYRIERSYGSFQRSFSLPEGVNEDEIKAKSRNGVLEITLPKSEKARDKVRKIDVKRD